MQLTLHVTRRTHHGASRVVLAMSSWSVKTRPAPSRHSLSECEGLWSVTVYRLPIRLPVKSALTWPVVQLVAYKPSQKLIVSSIPVGRTFFVEKKKKEEASPQGKNRAMWGEEAKPLKHKNDAERKSDL